MKKLSVAGALASVQALIIIMAGSLEVYNSYRYALTSASDYHGRAAETIVFAAPSTLFLVMFYFFFFFMCSCVNAVLLFQRRYLRICFGLTLLICAGSFFDIWVVYLRCDYAWMWLPAVRIFVAMAILHLLRPHALSEQAGQQSSLIFKAATQNVCDSFLRRKTIKPDFLPRAGRDLDLGRQKNALQSKKARG
jgi:hypothetical protein